jgi:uncharacterized membrane protein
MAIVSRAMLTGCITGVLLIPAALVFLLSGAPTSPAQAITLDDFGDNIRVTFDSATSTNVSVVVDSDGNMHIAWEDYRSGNGDIYYVKLDENGDKLTNDAKISNDSAISRNPSVAVDTAGHIYIVWENVESGSTELHFAKLWYYSGNITFQENGLQVSDSNPAFSSEPDIAICSDGTLALVWTDARHDSGDGNLEIYYKRLSQDGASLTNDIRVTSDVGVSERPHLDVDPAGAIHVVWYDFRDSNNGLVINHGVFYRKLAPTGLPLTNETRITFASPSSRPDAAVDTEGNVHVVFDDDRYASFDVFYTLLDNNGITLVDDRNISPKDGNESRCPRIALSDSACVDVVWQDMFSGSWEVHYSAISYDGSIQVFDQALPNDGIANSTGPVVMCARDNNTFIVYRGEVPNKELFFSRTHRSDVMIAPGDVRLSSVQPLEGATMWVNATVRNACGDTVDDLDVVLLVDGIPETETVVGPILAGGAAVISMTYTAEAGDAAVSIVLDPDEVVREADETNNAVTVPIFVRVPGVQAVSDATTRSAAPGETVTFNITVTNEGNYDALYSITNTSIGEGWTVDFGASEDGISVPGGGSGGFTVGVCVPNGTNPGGRALNISIACVERPSVNATLNLMVDVRQVGDVSITAPGGGIVEPTIPVTYAFTLTNEANANESFEIAAVDGLGWDISVSNATLHLQPDEVAEVSVEVCPSRYDPPGATNILTLSVSSMNLTANTANANVLLIVGHHREVDLSLSQLASVNFSAPEDRQIVYSLMVRNLGNSNDTIGLVLTGASSFWTVLNASYVLLEAGEAETVGLTMTPGLTVLAGQYAFNITATSEANASAKDIQMLSVNVQPFYDIHVEADIAEMVVRGGDQVYVNLTVENRGNTIDVVDLYIYTDTLNDTVVVFDGEEYPLLSATPPPITLEPGDETQLMIRIPVPLGLSPGDYVLLADISSLMDPLQMVSEEIVLTIEPKRPWLSIYVIVAIAAAAGAAALLLFLYLRMRARREAERVEAMRRQMQRKKRPPVANRKPRPQTGSQNP